MKGEATRILIVEDDSETSQSLAHLFEEKGYEAQTARGGAEALSKAESCSFNLALLDIRLPDMVGTDLLARLKKLHPDMVVIMLTGFTTLETAVDSLHQGAYAYIVKPITLDKITPIVEQSLEKQREVWEERKLMARVKEERQTYWELSIIDSLTQVYNRRHFDELLSREMAVSDRYHHPLSLLMIDVDGFKRYNDAYGHPAGDKALKKVAEVLKSSCRAVDIVARYGGEEFAVIAIQTDKERALNLAERLRKAIEESEFETDLGSSELGLTVSIGVASYPSDAGEKEELIDRADQALYRAKEMGKNKVCPFGKEGANLSSPDCS